MSRREAGVKVQNFTALLNCLVVVTRVVVAIPQPGVDHGCEGVEFKCPLGFGKRLFMASRHL